jgi:adenine C2-methylase RlmN of 23S rRNA A2503 and tRNA A37
MTTKTTQRFSKLDLSANILRPFGNGLLESRIVIRPPKKLCLYVSSHSGCIMKCGQCHLTANREFSFYPSHPKDYYQQVHKLVETFKNSKRYDEFKIKDLRININFMARGEPLMNPFVRNQWRDVYESILQAFRDHNMSKFPQINISTIMPHIVDRRGLDFFLRHTSSLPKIYYSSWSMQKDWKQRWMPNAIDTRKALCHLADYQSQIPDGMKNQSVIIHGAFVAGQNDNMNDIQELVSFMKQINLFARFNMIRYNRPNQGPFASFRESSPAQLDKIYNFLTRYNPGGVKRVERVGFDVDASCGMFSSSH